MSKLLKLSKSKQLLLDEEFRKVVLSGPSGFLGSRVLRSILAVHSLRREHGLNPGEIILLSSHPGRLMEKLVKEYGPQTMATVRASRVDYYTQHDTETWIDTLGSLGLEGDNCVFVNLAAVAGPDGGKGGLHLVNYNAPVAAAKACEHLGFGHWVQSSSQAIHTERAGQVRYSRGKAMADYALSRMNTLPVTVACLGVLYCKTDGIIGQDPSKGINLIDLSLLPITPIVGNGTAPLQPQEVSDASDRLAFLALTDPSKRPVQTPKRLQHKIQVEYGNCDLNGTMEPSKPSLSKEDMFHNNAPRTPILDAHSAPVKSIHSPTQLQQLQEEYDLHLHLKHPTSGKGDGIYREGFRKYDAVGPETITMKQMLHKFAKFQGRKTFRHVHIGYTNMEEILNITSLGNMNRQFLSLLRSEQESHAPILGDHRTWEGLLGPDAKLLTLDAAFQKRYEDAKAKNLAARRFPYITTAKLIIKSPRVIWPGMKLSWEVVTCYYDQVIKPEMPSTRGSNRDTSSGSGNSRNGGVRSSELKPIAEASLTKDGKSVTVEEQQFLSHSTDIQQATQKDHSDKKEKYNTPHSEMFSAVSFDPPNVEDRAENFPFSLVRTYLESKPVFPLF